MALSHPMTMVNLTTYKPWTAGTSKQLHHQLACAVEPCAEATDIPHKHFDGNGLHGAPSAGRSRGGGRALWRSRSPIEVQPSRGDWWFMMLVTMMIRWCLIVVNDGLQNVRMWIWMWHYFFDYQVLELLYRWENPDMLVRAAQDYNPPGWIIQSRTTKTSRLRCVVYRDPSRGLTTCGTRCGFHDSSSRDSQAIATVPIG